MTSFWCVSIKRLATRFAGAEFFFSMKPLYSTNRVLSVHRSTWTPIHPVFHSSAHRLAYSLVRRLMGCQLGCGCAALGTLCLCGEYLFTGNPEEAQFISVRISNLNPLSLGRSSRAQRCARLLSELQIARAREGAGCNESKVWPGRRDRSKLIGLALSPRRTSCQTKSTVVGKSRKLWHLLTFFGHDLALQRDSSRPSIGESCSANRWCQAS